MILQVFKNNHYNLYATKINIDNKYLNKNIKKIILKIMFEHHHEIFVLFNLSLYIVTTFFSLKYILN